MGNIRVIAGVHRGRKLPVLLSDGLRPTTDRIKETLFNWLMHDIRDATVLDMFAGAGSLGFEALSRHAAHVTMIEKDPLVANQLQKNLALLNEENRGAVVCGDALDVLSSHACQYDIVFVDPPFGKGLVMPAIDTLVQNEVLSKSALIYLEYESSTTLDLDILTTLKHKQSGQVDYSLSQIV